MTQRKVTCDYCGADAEPSSTGRGPIWLCVPCDAWVPVYANSPTMQPMGRFANAELREAKRLFQKSFHPIMDMIGRRKAYVWLAKEMGLSHYECDAHRFDLEQCRKARALCEQNLPPFAKD